MFTVTLKHTQVKKLAALTTRSSCLRCVSAAEQNSSPILATQNPGSISQEAIYHGILTMTSLRHQTFEKLLWKPSEDASQKSSLNQMWLPICQGHQTPLQHSSAWMGGDWDALLSDQETIVDILVFNFIPKRSHHSLTLPRWQFSDSATVTLTSGNGTTAIKVESLA